MRGLALEFWMRSLVPKEYVVIKDFSYLEGILFHECFAYDFLKGHA